MALTEELPIYRATYRLLNMLIRVMQNFPRFYKYSLGTRMVDVCLEMLMLIYKANSSYKPWPPSKKMPYSAPQLIKGLRIFLFYSLQR